MKSFLTVLAVLFVAVSARADWPRPTAPFYHAATKKQADQRSAHWHAKGVPVHQVAFTGSMRPWIHGGELVAMEPYHKQDLAPGMVVSFERSAEHPSVLHMVVSVNARAAYISGINCRHSDGWVPLHKIRFVLREVITAPR